MIEWNDIAKGQLPKKGDQVFWYPALCLGCLEENGIVGMYTDTENWDDLAYGFNQPEKHRYNKPLDVVQYWTEVNEP